MHTFKKETDGTYAVGQWLVGALEFKFMPLFYVSDRQNAIAAINALNGADLTKAPIYPDFHVIAEHEPKKRNRKGTFIWTSVLIGLMIGIAYGCTRANATFYWPGQPPPLIYAEKSPQQAFNPPQPMLASDLYGHWCRGEGSYVRNVTACPPTDRVTITSRKIIFHENECTVRSAVPFANKSKRMARQYHATFWCHNGTVTTPNWPVTSYWLGLWRGGDNLRLTETDSTFQPLDRFRFLREHPND